MPGAMENSKTSSRLSKSLWAMEQLRALHNGNGEVSIPGVVVAGEQSAGKSSVLEALGGMKLPRGQNITTRVPLILSLQAVPGAQPHASIGDDADPTKGKDIDIADISEEIQALTNTLAGEGTEVSSKPIYLRIIRDSGPILTLIDLPGITHLSEDIHTETLQLVRTYIENENMVVLAVMPAMSDFANSEALKEAKKYDPDGRRTLGVVTKTDNVQAGCGIKAKLRMEDGHVWLKLGFIAVVNRTPIEVEEDTPAEEVRAREEKFFTTTPELVGLGKEHWGLDTLVDRIVEIQEERIEEFVPKYLTQAKQRIKELRNELGKMPPSLTTNNELWDAYRKRVSQVIEWLKDLLAMRGDRAVYGSDLTMNVIPHVDAMYQEYAFEILEEVPNFFDDEYHDKATIAFKRVRGMALPNLLSNLAFDELFQGVFEEQLASHSEELVEGIKEYMQEVLGKLCEHACKGYPVLLKALKSNLVEDFMEAKEAKAKEAVGNIVEAELDWVFTQDRSYGKTMEEVKAMVTDVRKSRADCKAVSAVSHCPTRPLQATEVGGVGKDFIEKMVACEDINVKGVIYDLQVTLFAYSDVVCRRMFDVVPKHVQFILVKGLCNGFEDFMMQNAKTSDLKEWFAEDAQSERHRREMGRKLSQFQEAVKILKIARS